MSDRLELGLCYYTGEWSEDDKQAAKAILEASGWSVTDESIGLIESAEPQQLLQLIITLGEEIGHVALDKAADALITALLLALHQLWSHFRQSGKEPHAVTLDVIEIRYIIMSEEQIDSILEDLASDDRLKGEKRWREGRWMTYEEMYPGL